MSMTPREIVHELNRHIIGQDDAKRAVASALRRSAISLWALVRVALATAH